MEKNTGMYASYELDDFLNDDNFKEWVKYPSEESDQFWNKVTTLFPDKKQILLQARNITILLSHPVKAVPAGSKDKVWLNIEEELALRYNFPLRQQLRKGLRIAATVFLLIATGFTARYCYENSEKTFTAGYGKLRTVNLPDGSRVVLNANSEIRYKRKWHAGRSRELWMSGEALFEVKHLAGAKKSEADTFSVHTGKLTVTVLGTVFDIKVRRNSTQVTLRKGLVRIDFDDQRRAAVYLHPGEKLDFDGVSGQLAKAPADTMAVTAWTQRKLILKGDNLLAVIAVLEDNYGYHVALRDPSLANRKLEGTVPVHSADDLLFVVRKVFNVNVEQHADSLIIY